MTDEADYDSLYMRYLGVLKLLEIGSPYVDEDIRESIEDAFIDACRAHSGLKTGRLLNHLTIEVKPL